MNIKPLIQRVKADAQLVNASVRVPRDTLRLSALYQVWLMEDRKTWLPMEGQQDDGTWHSMGAFSLAEATQILRADGSGCMFMKPDDQGTYSVGTISKHGIQV